MKHALPIVLLSLLLASTANAALVETLIIGTWDAASADPTTNPFGLAVGDKLLMKSTHETNGPYFLNSFGFVTTTLDPSVIAGTSFEVIIPHAGAAPNPLVFDHSDHVSIGFASHAEMNFDGPSTANPGNFVAYELSAPFTFQAQSLEFDTFIVVVPESFIINFQTANFAARGSGAMHLSPAVPVVADAGGPHIYGFGATGVLLTGFATGNGFAFSYEWSEGGVPLPGSPSEVLGVLIADSGLVDTTDTTIFTLDVTEAHTGLADTATADVFYENSAPLVSNPSAVSNPDGSITFTANATDIDTIVNAFVPGFETLTLTFRFGPTTFLTGSGSIDAATAEAIFGGPGLYSVDAVATDFAGATDVVSFDVQVGPVPVPALSGPAAALLVLLVIAVAGRALASVGGVRDSH